MNLQLILNYILSKRISTKLLSISYYIKSYKETKSYQSRVENTHDAGYWRDKVHVYACNCFKTKLIKIFR